MTPDVIVPWDDVESFAAADRQFVTTVRGVAEHLRDARPLDADLEDWLVRRVPEIERTHQQILVAQTELRSPAPGQSMDWLVERIHQLTGCRQTLGVSYSPDWNTRILKDLVATIAPGMAVALKEDASTVSSAAAQLNSVCTEIRRARKDDPFHDRKMYAENHDWFWERRDQSENYHIWNGTAVPVDAPNRAAAIYFSGEADGYRLPVCSRRPSGSADIGSTYGSLLGAADDRRRQFAHALDQCHDDTRRPVLYAELYPGRLPLLSTGEGTFGAWWLTDQQYAGLQSLCEAHGWPKDLWIESTPWWRYLRAVNGNATG